MKKIYVLGNPILEEDSIAIKIANMLKKEMKGCTFIYYDPAEPLPPEPIFLDVSPDVKKVELIEDVERLQEPKAYTLHDFDLAFLLKIMKEIGKIKKIKIIVVPSVDESKLKNMVKEVKKMLESL